jgi:hypothetical protein
VAAAPGRGVLGGQAERIVHGVVDDILDKINIVFETSQQLRLFNVIISQRKQDDKQKFYTILKPPTILQSF